MEFTVNTFGARENDYSLLVGDIERRQAYFAVAHGGGGPFIDLQHVSAIDTHAYVSLEAALTAYLDTLNVRPEIVSLAIAGPIHDEVISLTDSGWTFRRDRLADSIGLAQAHFMNDFEAMARGATLVASTELETIADGIVDFAAPIVVLGPGEGLGMSVVRTTDGRIEPWSAEGGHAPFAPKTETEVLIWRSIVEELGYASYEDVLSEKGIRRIHRVLAESAAENDDISAATLEVFCQVLGTFTAAAVLMTGARGGVILGGTLLTEMPQELLTTHFLDRFYDVGRMRPYLARVPVRLIRSREAVLLGAASAQYDAAEQRAAS